MKKIVLIVLIALSLTACSLSNTPTGRVESYLNQYNQLSDDVKTDMETKISSENLSTENTDIYRKVLTRQYQDMKYEVKDEKIDGDKATVIVKLSVYDLYKVDKDAYSYLNNHQDEFTTNGMYDENIYSKYKLEHMLDTQDKVDYEVTFNLSKKDGQWSLENPDRVTLEKIHGLYNYENE